MDAISPATHLERPQERRQIATIHMPPRSTAFHPHSSRAPTIDLHDQGVIGDTDQIDTLIDQLAVMQILDAWNSHLLHD
jgi:hypothetical protein